MKKMHVMMLACILLLAVVSIAQEKPWFDPKGCAICSKYAAEPGLMQHMHTEFLDVADGTVQVCHVDKEFQAAYMRANQAAEKVIADLQAGKQVPLDMYCQTINGFYASGVNPEMFQNASGDVLILRSSDAAQQKKIKEFASKTKEELARMAAPMASESK